MMRHQWGEANIGQPTTSHTASSWQWDFIRHLCPSRSSCACCGRRTSLSQDRRALNLGNIFGTCLEPSNPMANMESWTTWNTNYQELPETKIHAVEKIDATFSTESLQFAQWLVHRIEIWHFLHVDQIDDGETLDLLLDSQHLKDHQESFKQDLERKTKIMLLVKIFENIIQICCFILLSIHFMSGPCATGSHDHLQSQPPDRPSKCWTKVLPQSRGSHPSWHSDGNHATPSWASLGLEAKKTLRS